MEQENGFLRAFRRQLQAPQFTERHDTGPGQHGAT
jgi:hypothetical protein